MCELDAVAEDFEPEPALELELELELVLAAFA